MKEQPQRLEITVNMGLIILVRDSIQYNYICIQIDSMMCLECIT